MLLRKTLVLILLQLHASSTLTDTDKEQNGSTIKMKRIRRTVGAEQQKTPSHEPSRSTPLQDEDLLDLMVRIAQSPSEWERIQQVLSQLGKTNNPRSSERKEEDLNMPNVMTSDSKRNIDRSKDTVQHHANVRVSSVTTLPPNLKRKYYESSPPTTTEDTDSGWPDFEEAILKKVRKPERKSDEMLENNVFENDWFDTSWSDFTDEEKDQESLMEKLIVKPPAVSFVKLNITEGDSSARSPPSSRKTMYSGPGVFDLTSREEVSTRSEVYVDVSNRSSRPVFTYHRVTTGPQERKSNSAIIAVSVARRNQETPSPAPSNNQSTQRVQNNFEDSFKRIFERHRSKEGKESLPRPATQEHFRHHTHTHH